MSASNFMFQRSNSGLRAVLFLITCLVLSVSAASAAKWGGVDESVIEKYAEEHGRAPREPLINTDQGDLLLFAFLTAGAAGGFAAGYYWRQLTERARNPEHRSQTGQHHNTR